MFEMAPSTKRPAKLLSRVYGYGSPRELAASLPDNAVVTDFGAGRSNFGETIVGLRDDITWLNIDPRYTTANAQRAQRIADALAMVQMDAFSKRYPAQLSGGQQQRIALARALVFDPKLVLMDEPLGALDKQLREHMQLELKALHKKLGITFVYVTHDQSEALTMSDRVAVFDQGIIQQVSSVNTLYESPCNRFVAGFVGDCNQYQGVVQSIAGENCVVRLTPDIVLTGINVNQAPAGAPCVLTMRPERLRIVDSHTAVDGNVFKAHALDSVYFGDHVRLRCSIPDTPSFFVKLPLGGGSAVQPGTQGGDILLHVPPEYVRVFNP